MPAYCAQGKEGYSYRTLDMKTYTLLGNQISALIDHSKLAILDNKKTICFGDINRAYSQSKRCVYALMTRKALLHMVVFPFLSGGGTVCFDSPALWAQMSAKIVYWDKDCSGIVPDKYVGHGNGNAEE